MDIVAQQRRTRLIVNVMAASLLGLICVFAGAAVWSVMTEQKASDRLERSGRVAAAYLEMIQASAVQDALDDDLVEDPSASTRSRFDAASAVIARNLVILERDGEREDRELQVPIARVADDYQDGIHAIFAATTAGNLARAEEIDDNVADPMQVQLQTLLSQRGPVRAHETVDEIGGLLDDSRQTLKVFLMLLVPLGGVLAAAWFVLRSLRRRIETMTTQELARLEDETLTDSLTGALNHRAFIDDLARASANLRAGGPSLSLAMVDLDGLKQINDTHGHPAGDRAIRSVARAMRETARAEDCVYRVGGDEFAVILPGTSQWGAFDFAQRLHSMLAGMDAPATVGLIEAISTDGPDDLVKNADAALLEGKRSRRATTIFAPGLVSAEPQAADFERIVPTHQETLASALARAVDAKDSYTHSHSETVAELCGLTALQLGFDSAHARQVRLAGLVHDIGKIGIPDAILRKPGPLDDDEYEMIKTHPQVAHTILRGTELKREADWVLRHHERPDGRGYPMGLTAEEIPIEASIISVADAYEAMTSVRPYRQEISGEEAVEELRRHSGAQFDPTCVDALVKALSLEGPAEKPDAQMALTAT